MTGLGRVCIASRIFGLAAILGLSLALSNPQGLRGTVLLAAVSTAAMVAELGAPTSTAWTALIEAALSALLIELVLPAAAVVLPYLLVPALVAGVTQGWRLVLGVTGAQLFGLVLMGAATGDQRALHQQAPVVAPWLLTAFGVGLLATWLRQTRLVPLGPVIDTTYESAHRLLSQLRTVARRLSSGLDTVTLASQLLSAVHDHVGDARAAVFVRSEGGVLAPLLYSGADASQAIDPNDPLARTCWDEMEPVQGSLQSARADGRRRIVLPLRAGSRMIGVIIADAEVAASNSALTDLMRELDEQSLRLDTAMVFDEVRSIATVEERHRLAREIHDGVAQEIASLGYALDDLLAKTMETDRRKDIFAIRSEITRVVSELRLSIFDLRSQITPGAGLGSALSDYVRQVGARSEMTVHLTLDESPTRLRAETETELLRIAQEAITNARKHSGARNLWVHCRVRPPHARIQVRDDGKGLGGAGEDSYGMRIMRERARRIQAKLQVDTERGEASGTTVLVTLGDEIASDSVVDRREDERHERVRREHGPTRGRP